MKVCPKCGYRDPPIWRNTLRRLFAEHCHISDLEIWNPELAAALKEKRYLCIKGVKYRLNKKGAYVHRIDAFLCKYPNENDPRITEPDTESGRAKALGVRRKGQTVLGEATR